MEINVIPDNFQPESPLPFEAPFILSSMERCWCHGVYNANEIPPRIRFIKRRHLEENLKVVAGEFGMNEQEQTNFLDYWCQTCAHNDKMILAENVGAFDLRYRVKSWMSKRRRPGEEPQKSRLENYTDKSNQINNLINELYGTRSDRGAAAGDRLSPEEQ